MVGETLNWTEPSTNIRLKREVSSPGVQGSPCNSKDNIMIAIVSYHLKISAFDLLADFSFLASYKLHFFTEPMTILNKSVGIVFNGDIKWVDKSTSSLVIFSV